MLRFAARRAAPIACAAAAGTHYGMALMESSEGVKCEVNPVSYRGRQALRIGSDQISTTVLLGGGHIALIQLPEDAKKFEEASQLPNASDASDFGSPLVRS